MRKDDFTWPTSLKHHFMIVKNEENFSVLQNELLISIYIRSTNLKKIIPTLTKSSYFITQAKQTWANYSINFEYFYKILIQGHTALQNTTHPA